MNEIQNCAEDYLINRFTMAIMPESSKMYSRVLEYEDDLVVQKRPIEIIDDSCRYFGSSYLGRKEGTKDLIRVTHKSPIVIDPANSIYFFPTTSSTRPNCIWISHDYVKEYSKAEHDNTMITFKNGKQITIPISLGSFEKQLFRTSYLSNIISSRIEQEQRKLNMLLFPNGEKEVNTLYEHIIREITRNI